MAELEELRLRARMSQATDTLEILPAPTDAIVRAGRRATLRDRMLMGTAVVAAVGAAATATVLTRPTHAVQQAVPAAGPQARTAPTPGSLGPKPVPPRGSVTLETGTFDGQSWTVTRHFGVQRDPNISGWDSCEHWVLTMDGVKKGDAPSCGMSMDPAWENRAEQEAVSGESNLLFLTKSQVLNATHNAPYLQLIGVSSQVAKATMHFKGAAPIPMALKTVTQLGVLPYRYAMAEVPEDHGRFQDVTYYDAKGHVLDVNHFGYDH